MPKPVLSLFLLSLSLLQKKNWMVYKTIKELGKGEWTQGHDITLEAY
jgi:hypothetical protein